MDTIILICITVSWISVLVGQKMELIGIITKTLIHEAVEEVIGKVVTGS